ncbi:MAG: signal recognition particle-docking protein FtsY [Calditrichaeota bacterium]|nr:signal recognition particle-docking protein FtsY [Calditrichota bacterium]RQW08343.1 MAG: signal recognition particle-docking protein FtsY [Calditrichota bacterium]
MNLFDKLKSGLSKTRRQVFDQIQDVIFFARTIDDDLLEEIEELLIAGDVGVDTTLEIIERVKRQVKRRNYENADQLFNLLKEEIAGMFVPPANKHEQENPIPFVIFVVGVNGTGKTTSIAKLAWRYRQKDKNVLLVAADTFRAAAIEQLQIWSERAGVDMVKHQEGADPSAVVFDAMTHAKNQHREVVIIDTAGRLHTKVNLMEELKKMKRVIQKIIPEAPHQKLLVLDATTGQNAVLQARQFIEVIGIDGIILAKLDGTAKGGSVIGISHTLELPVEYVGLGEKIDDLEPFDPQLFAEGLFQLNNQKIPDKNP